MYNVANLEHYALVEWQGSGETGGNAHVIHMVTAKTGENTDYPGNTRDECYTVMDGTGRRTAWNLCDTGIST